MSAHADTLRHPSYWLLLFLAVLPAAHAQSVLYITDGDASKLQAIDTTTGSILYSVNSSNEAYPIAVRNTVILGLRQNPGLTGEYNLVTGALIGTLQSPTGTSWDQALDGAAGATNNYTLSFSGGGAYPVYQTAADWSNASLLFSISGSNLTGITFDSDSGNLWFSDSSSIYQYTTSGTLVSQFTHDGGRGSLAYQYGTDTLWFVPNSASSPLLQYSTTGTLLQSLTVNGRSGNVWGAEFSAIPEPSTSVLLALGAGLLGFVYRRRLG